MTIQPEAPPKAERLVSLDALSGFDMLSFAFIHPRCCR